MKLEQLIEEYRDVLLGKMLGYGCYRVVYECALNKDYVVKIENANGGFSNIKEWKLWEEVEYTPFKKYFAPCIFISDNGKVLIQKKVRLVLQEELPKEVPYFFTDVKPENFGFIGKQFVCCDYGSIPFSHKWSEKRKRKPYWDRYYTNVAIR